MDNFIEEAYARGAAAAMDEFGIKTASAVKALVVPGQAGATRSATVLEQLQQLLGAPKRGLDSYMGAIRSRTGQIAGNKEHARQLQQMDAGALHHSGVGMTNREVLKELSRMTNRAQLERAGLIAAPVAGAGALGAGAYYGLSDD